MNARPAIHPENVLGVIFGWLLGVAVFVLMVGVIRSGLPFPDPDESPRAKPDESDQRGFDVLPPK